MRTLNVVLVGMVVVFATLTLMIFCIKLYSAIIAKLSNRNNSSNNNTDNGNDRNEIIETTNANSNSTSNELNPELIAVIAAAIAASMGGSSSGIRVRSIKRIGHTTPVWNVAGRNEYILSKL